jgi:hypothetical protein
MVKHADVLDGSHGSQRNIKEADMYREGRKDTVIGGVFVGQMKLPLSLDMMVEHGGLQGLLVKSGWKRT